ncbi:MAG: hypothetical protein RL302_2357 [Pseudomonadota bacterium]
MLIGVRMRAARHGWSMEQNEGRLSNVLAKEMPVLEQPGIWADITDAVNQAYMRG